MFYTAQGFKCGFFTALNRCIATSLFPAPQKALQGDKNSLAFERAPRAPRNLAQEKYLAIPTYIRQGKILGL